MVILSTNLSDDSAQAALQLTNDIAEDVKVIRKLSSIHIHGIVVQLLKLLRSCLKVCENLFHTVGQRLSLHSVSKL